MKRIVTGTDQGGEIRVMEMNCGSGGNETNAAEKAKRVAANMNALQALDALGSCTIMGLVETSVNASAFLERARGAIKELQRERDDARQQLLAANQQILELEEGRKRLLRRYG
jgi:hypothetical protein